MRGGTEYQGEYQGNELEWNLSTEIRRLRPLFNDMAWPREKLDGITQIVSALEVEPRIDHLIELCVRS